MNQAVEAGNAWEDTFPLRAKDGQYRWFLSRAVPIRNDQGEIQRWFGTNTDIDERRRRIRNIQFSNELNEEMSHLSNESEIMRFAANKICSYLDVSSCHFTRVDLSRDEATVIYDCTLDSDIDLVGNYRLSEFLKSEVISLLSSGKQFVVNDTESDPRTSHTYVKLKSMGIRSFITSPFLKDGIWKSSFIIQSRQPRKWRQEEMELLREVLERISSLKHDVSGLAAAAKKRAARPARNNHKAAEPADGLTDEPSIAASIEKHFGEAAGIEHVGARSPDLAATSSRNAAQGVAADSRSDGAPASNGVAGDPPESIDEIPSESKSSETTSLLGPNGDTNFHAWLSARVAMLDQERQGIWRKFLGALLGR